MGQAGCHRALNCNGHRAKNAVQSMIRFGPGTVRAPSGQRDLHLNSMPHARQGRGRRAPRREVPFLAAKTGTTLCFVPWPVEFLDVDGAHIAYRVHGTGPPLLAPECNYTWSDEVEARLAERFTLIVASPRDYGQSRRTGGPAYDVGRWATDLQAVARWVGYDRFLFFGYSFTGAFGPWLARQLRDSSAVAAIAAGGFPLLVVRL